MSRSKIIFLGNGMLADFVLPILAKENEIIFHARKKEDLRKVSELKKQNPEAFAVLASFGVMIPRSLLAEFEPEGIINIHPSFLPKYRGASPIESAILAGDTDFGVSVMKLAPAMDAGPIYHQELIRNIPLDKTEIYQSLATRGADWLNEHLPEIRELRPASQDGSEATYTEKFDKLSDSDLQIESTPAWKIYRQIVAFQKFPKPKYEFFGKKCIILEAKLADGGDEKVLKEAKKLGQVVYTKKRLFLECKDGGFVEILRLQPEGKQPMSVVGFLNGYAR